MMEIEETERIDCFMPYLQDLVIMDSRSGKVLCSRLDIEYMTIDMPFIGIQARED